MVIIQSKLRGWVIDVDFIIIFVRLNNKRYIFCYFIFKYDYNHILDLYVCYLLFIIIYFANVESVISYHFNHNCFESVKELHKFPFPILVYTSIGTYTIPNTYNQLTPNSGVLPGVIQSWWAIY